MIARIDVLGGDACAQPPVDVDRERLRLALQQALGREHVPDFGRADAEGERAEGAVRAVWLSPQTIVMPGCVRPSSGPMTCTMPRCVAAEAEQLDAELAAVLLHRRTWLRRGLDPDRHAAEDLRRGRSASSGPASRACDRAGAPAGPRRAARANACGEVTSWMRCRSTYSTAGVSAVSGTTSCAPRSSRTASSVSSPEHGQAGHAAG